MKHNHSSTHSAENAKTRLNRRRALLSLLSAALISAIVLLITTQFRETLAALRGLGVFGILILSFLGNATVLVPAPAFVMACAGGQLYGALSSGLAAGVGSALGEITGFLAGYGGTAFLPQGETYQRLRRAMQHFGGWLIFAMALLPNPLFDVGGAVAGMLKMPLWLFLLATTCGKVLRMLLVAWACANGIGWLESLFQQP